LHVAVVRSPMAHARVTGVDVSAAFDQPGVVAAYTGADLAEHWAGGLPCAWPVTEEMRTPVHLPIATDEVRYAGDAVAVVVARTRYQAADATEFVVVDYEPLPVVTDMEAALADGADLADTSLDSNECFTWPMVNGDIDAAFDGAEHVVTRRFVNQRLIPTAIEPRAVVCAPPRDQREYTMWSATQVPHILRLMLALTCGVPEHELRVVAPDVGGGFGSKLNVYAEEAICLVLAKLLDQPVKWTESRTEGYQATIHGRDQIQDVSLALDEDGRIRGLKVKLLADMGAYLQLVTPGVPLLGAFMFNAIYKMDALSFECTGVFTNKTPTDAYRGAGRPEATYAIERLIDEAANELGMEPFELRERNWIKHEEFPYDTIAGITYDSGNYEAATAKARETFGYEDMRAEQARRRESGDPVQLGIGISTFTEMCGLAPSRVLGSLAYGAGGWEHASVRMLATGKVEVVTGTSPHGQGHVTAWSQIAAQALGVSYEDVEVRHGDTAIAHKGMDTYGSRSLVVGGYAVQVACDKVIAKAKRVAAHLLEASEDDLEFEDGRFAVRGSPDAAKTIQDTALAVFAAHDYPEGMEPSL
ncbi:MAG: xanthine dehydrogenase family protein molybdopterin-binding subunit, partial [Nitriliruptoraceae bacterium]